MDPGGREGEREGGRGRRREGEGRGGREGEREGGRKFRKFIAFQFKDPSSTRSSLLKCEVLYTPPYSPPRHPMTVFTSDFM